MVSFGREEIEFFSPLHLLILLFSALILLGLPLLIALLLARWLDRRLQARPNVRVSLVAVVIGGFTDVVATMILAIPLVFYLMIKYDLSHASKGAIASSIHSNAWLYALQLAIGLSCSVLGGYVAARIARHDELLNGLLSSFLCTAIGFYSLLSGKDSQSVPVQILLLISAPAFSFLGGYFGQTQKRMRRAPA